jgi:hypothetical protein
MYRVTNPDKIKRVLAMCRVAAGTVATAKSIPFESPCSIDHSTLLPAACDIVVSPKADGVRFLLCLCEDAAGRPIASLVNRAEEVFSTNVKAPRGWYRTGTVYDGEMCAYLPDRSKRVFLVFNVLMHGGMLLFHTPYRTRLARLARTVSSAVLTGGERDVFGKQLLVSACDSIHIVAKECYPGTKIREVLENPPTMFNTDGLVLTPTELPMTTGRNRALLKWTDNTIDVRLVVGEDNRFDLFAADHGVPVRLSDVFPHMFAFDEALKTVVRGARLFREILGLPRTPFDELTELSITPGPTPILSYVRLRRDKTTPNDLYTIQRTLVAAESWITGDALAAALGA